MLALIAWCAGHRALLPDLSSFLTHCRDLTQSRSMVEVEIAPPGMIQKAVRYVSAPTPVIIEA